MVPKLKKQIEGVTTDESTTDNAPPKKMTKRDVKNANKSANAVTAKIKKTSKAQESKDQQEYNKLESEKKEIDKKLTPLAKSQSNAKKRLGEIGVIDHNGNASGEIGKKIAEKKKLELEAIEKEKFQKDERAKLDSEIAQKWADLAESQRKRDELGEQIKKQTESARDALDNKNTGAIKNMGVDIKYSQEQLNATLKTIKNQEDSIDEANKRLQKLKAEQAKTNAATEKEVAKKISVIDREIGKLKTERDNLMFEVTELSTKTKNLSRLSERQEEIIQKQQSEKYSDIRAKKELNQTNTASKKQSSKSNSLKVRKKSLSNQLLEPRLENSQKSQPLFPIMKLQDFQRIYGYSKVVFLPMPSNYNTFPYVPQIDRNQMASALKQFMPNTDVDKVVSAVLNTINSYNQSLSYYQRPEHYQQKNYQQNFGFQWQQPQNKESQSTNPYSFQYPRNQMIGFQNQGMSVDRPSQNYQYYTQNLQSQSQRSVNNPNIANGPDILTPRRNEQSYTSALDPQSIKPSDITQLPDGKSNQVPHEIDPYASTIKNPLLEKLTDLNAELKNARDKNKEFKNLYRNKEGEIKRQNPYPEQLKPLASTYTMSTGQVISRAYTTEEIKEYESKVAAYDNQKKEIDAKITVECQGTEEYKKCETSEKELSDLRPKIEEIESTTKSIITNNLKNFVEKYGDKEITTANYNDAKKAHYKIAPDIEYAKKTPGFETFVGGTTLIQKGWNDYEYINHKSQIDPISIKLAQYEKEHGISPEEKAKLAAEAQTEISKEMESVAVAKEAVKPTPNTSAEQSQATPSVEQSQKPPVEQSQPPVEQSQATPSVAPQPVKVTPDVTKEPKEHPRASASDIISTVQAHTRPSYITTPGDTNIPPPPVVAPVVGKGEAQAHEGP